MDHHLRSASGRTQLVTTIQLVSRNQHRWSIRRASAPEALRSHRSGFAQTSSSRQKFGIPRLDSGLQLLWTLH